MNILSTHSPMLSWKMQFLHHFSSPSSLIWKIPRQKGVVFWDKHFEYPQPCYLEKYNVCPASPLEIVGFNKLQDKMVREWWTRDNQDPHHLLMASSWHAIKNIKGSPSFSSLNVKMLFDLQYVHIAYIFLIDMLLKISSLPLHFHTLIVYMLRDFQ